LQATYALPVNENVAVGTVVGTIAATDPDGTAPFGQQAYSFLNGTVASALSSDGRYRINATTGVITTAVALDFEAGTPSQTYTVIARDNAGGAGYLQASSAVTIAIANLNEANAIQANYAWSVAENMAIGTGLGTVAATDFDSASVAFGQQRYYFLNGTAISGVSSDGRYKIDSVSGAITTDAVLDFEAGATSVAYTVAARDNLGAAGYLQATSTVTLGITNVNEANGLPANTALSINENVPIGTFVGTITANDPDSTSTAFGQQRYYFLNGTATSATSADGRYAINATTGVITTAAALNYEAGAATGPYSIVARDNAGGAGYLQASTTLTVGINDVNERPNNLVIEAQNLFSETLAGDTPHSNQLIARFTLSDPDGNPPTLAIIGGNGNGWFTIAGGHIAFTGANFSADWLRATLGQYGQDGGFYYDTDGDGLMEIRVATLTLAAVDAQGLQSDPLTYNVLIEDKKEAPVWGANPFTFNVFENPASYQYVGAVSGTDIDGPAGELRYLFYNGGWYYDSAIGQWASRSADNKFVMNGVTGAIYTNGAQALDFEGTRNFSYATLIYDKAMDPNSSVAGGTVNINLLNVDEPHSVRPQTFFLSEGTKGPLYTAADLVPLVTDPDGAPMQWRFAGGATTSGIWQISGDGKISLISGVVDYEGLVDVYDYVEGYDPYSYEPTWTYQYLGQDPSRAIFNLGVEAYQNGGYSAGTTVTLQVTDVNEAPAFGSYEYYNQSDLILTQNSSLYYIRSDKNEGPIVQIYGVDPEQTTNFYFEITDPVVALGYITAGGSSEIDGPRPVLYINASTGLLSFETPGSEGDWEGGIKENGVRQTLSMTYSFNVMIRDASGNPSSTPMTIVFLRRGQSVPPIVLDLDGDGLELIGVDASAVAFDMDLDGIANRTGWVGADDGFLALDRNGNGMIDDIGEISFIDDAPGAASDLEGLRAYDSNQNGFFDAGDAAFASFRVWRDANQDGVSQADELKTLAEHGIVQINLSQELTGESPASSDNAVYATSDFLREDGSSGTVGDVFLTYEPSDPIAAPVILDFDGDGAALVTLAASKIRFDMDGDGTAERTGWIESGDAFLALDRNKDGKIGDIAEISFVGDLAGAKTDLEGLKAFDSNGDGLLSALDARFAEFKLWFDTNSNGVSDAGEIRSLAEAGLASISLVSTPVDAAQRSVGGNIVFGKGSYVLTDGSTGSLLDAGLAYAPGDGSAGTGLSAWTGGGSPSTSADIIVPAPHVERQDFDRRVSKYMLTTMGGIARILPRSTNGTIDDRAGATGPSTLLSFANGTIGLVSPILLDLDGDGIEMRSIKKAHARFDANGDGIADDMGWVGKGDGMLVIDRNKDGRITSASELGFLAEKPDARSGFDALSALDANRDGKLDSSDTRFAELRIWVDANGDGVTDAGELASLADHGIASITLSSQAVNQNVKVGANALVATSVFTRTNGAVGTVGDAVLAYRPGGALATPTLAALRAGLDDGRRPLDFSFPEQDSQKAAVGNDDDPGAFTGDTGAFGDTRLLLMAQQMAAFGAKAGEGEWRGAGDRRESRFDYFAA